MCLILNIIVSSKWLCWSIDTKSAFLQNKNVDRVFYVKLPKEANCQDSKLCKSNTTIYRLNDASRSWCLNVKIERQGLGAIVCKSVPAVFIWHNQPKVNGLLHTQVNVFLFVGTELFLNKVINPINCVFKIELELCCI